VKQCPVTMRSDASPPVLESSLAGRQEDEDYFRVLGLRPGASKAQIRAAYHESAKLCHPDLNSDPSAAQAFERIRRAYDALMNLHVPNGPGVRRIAPQNDRRVLHPLRCSGCGAVTLLPRYATATTVKSIFLVSARVRSEGVLCAHCSNRQVLKANLLSGLLGWWSVPGIFLTPLYIYRNLFRATPNAELNLRYLCHNLLAFDASGERAPVREIADELCHCSARLPLEISYITERGRSGRNDVVPAGPPQKDWRLSARFVLANIAVGISGPAGLLLLWARFRI
jgi:hypothetical protein